jgi:hypothetical protein
MKNKTRLGFSGNLDLQMNLVVNRSFGDGACGKGESGHDQDPNQRFSMGKEKKKELRENIRC